MAVIDADYVVSEDWLIDLVPLFDDPKVGLVQAPQDHRDSQESLIKQAMNAEYAGFFDIGMVERNEENAIAAHGTILMARLSAYTKLETDTSPREDSELGLRFFKQATQRTIQPTYVGDTPRYVKPFVPTPRWAMGLFRS